jgi:hypothetical protein
MVFYAERLYCMGLLVRCQGEGDEQSTSGNEIPNDPEDFGKKLRGIMIG